jgi:hypothetical protein
VEQGFGTLKRRAGFDRARYLAPIETEMEFYLHTMAIKLKKTAAMFSERRSMLSRA